LQRERIAVAPTHCAYRVRIVVGTVLGDRCPLSTHTGPSRM